MKKKTAALFLAASLVLSLLAGCSEKAPPETSPTDFAPVTQSETPSSQSPESPAPTDPSAPAESQPVKFTDSAGREVELPSNITKVSPSGALAQMFILAIAPDLLCTIASEYSDKDLKYIPDGVAGLPVVGQFYGSEDLNIESIAAIGPEIVIDIGEPKKTIVEDMDSITGSLAIPAIHITATLDSSPEAFRTLGKILGREAEGEALAQYCEKALAQTNDVLSKVGDNKTSALYLMGDAGLNVLAATSFHAEVLDKVANNVAIVDEPSAKGSGNETDLEQILIWNPEVIIFSQNSVYGTAADDPTWSEVRAIKDGRYYEVPFGPYNWMGMPPSINRYLGMMWLTQLLYPEYAEYDLQVAVTEYYKMFYHYELSSENYAELTANSLA